MTSSYAATQTMLHQKDSRLLMLNALERDTVFAMDLHRGEVIEEWVSSVCCLHSNFV